jgi:hypothetical protein
VKQIIAGYTAAPADRTAAAEYYGALVQVSEADGLEFAWTGAQTAEQLDYVVRMLPAAWSITFNDIPTTWRACMSNPAFGLASSDESGRAAAMTMLREEIATIKAMNDRAGRKLVLAAEIHCAPGFDKRDVPGSADAFRRSLMDASQLDWDGCSVLVEHCDAFVAGQKPGKGFLPLDDEIAALASLDGAPIGLSLNWGRSLVELHDPARVQDHVTSASRSGLLRGFTFSGTAGTANVYGEAWADSHLPFAATRSGAYNEPASLMQVGHVAPLLDHLRDCEFVAIKTNWPAARTDPQERAASVVENFYTLQDAMRRTTSRAADGRTS